MKILNIILILMHSISLLSQEQKILLDDSKVKIIFERHKEDFRAEKKLNTSFKVNSLYYSKIEGHLDTFAYFSYMPINDKVFFDGTYLTFLINCDGIYDLCIFKLQDNKFSKYASLPITALPNKRVNYVINQSNIYALDYMEITDEGIKKRFYYEILPNERSYIMYDSKEDNQKTFIRKANFRVQLQSTREQQEQSEQIYQKYLDLKAKGELDNYIKEQKNIAKQRSSKQ